MKIMNFGHYVNLLKNKSFVKYTVAQIVSVFGDVLFKISITWFAIESTNSIFPIAMMLLLSYLPQILVGFIGGFLVDKYDRKKIMVVCDVVSFVLLFVIWIVSFGWSISIVLFYIVRFFLSLMDVFYTPASMAYLPKIIPAKELVNANSFIRVVRESICVIGAGAAGIMVATLGANTIFIINGVTFLFAAIMVLSIPINGKVIRVDENIKFNFKSLTKGFRYIKNDEFVKQFVIIIFLSNIVYDITYNLPSVYARDVLQLGADGYGYIQTALSLGAIAGGLVLGIIKSKRVGIIFASSTIIAGLMLLLLGINTSIFFGILLYFLFSLTDFLSIPCFTYLQLHVEDPIKGRVFAAFDTLVLFATPFAVIIIALFADLLGVSQMYRLVGVSLSAIGLFAFSQKAFIKAKISTMERRSKT